MSLIRCPGCKIDTSDSLAHCPNCGRSIGGSGQPLFDQRPASQQHEPQPFALESTTPQARPSSDVRMPSTDPGVGKVVKGLGLLIVLLILTFVPSMIPVVVMAAVFWLMAKRQKSGRSSPQIEALKIFVNEVSRAGTTGSKERPLEMLRRIEQQLKNQRKGQT